MACAGETCGQEKVLNPLSAPCTAHRSLREDEDLQADASECVPDTWEQKEPPRVPRLRVPTHEDADAGRMPQCAGGARCGAEVLRTRG